MTNQRIRLAALLLFTLSTGFAFTAEPKNIAVVNMQVLVAKHWKLPLADQRIKTTLNTLQKQLDAIKAEQDGLVKKAKGLDLELKSPSVKDKAAKEKAFNDLKLQITQKQQLMVQSEKKFQAELDRTRQTEHNAILVDIRQAINQYAAAKNIDMVFEASAANTPLLYAKKQFDITAEILKMVEGPKAATTAKKAVAPKSK